MWLWGRGGERVVVGGGLPFKISLGCHVSIGFNLGLGSWFRIVPDLWLVPVLSRGFPLCASREVRYQRNDGMDNREAIRET